MLMVFRFRKACAVLLGQALMASIAVQGAAAQEAAPAQEPAGSTSPAEPAALRIPPFPPRLAVLTLLLRLRQLAKESSKPGSDNWNRW